MMYREQDRPTSAQHPGLLDPVASAHASQRQAKGMAAPVGKSSWPVPVWTALALTAAVLALDVLLPGLPAKHPGMVGRLATLMMGICPQRPSHSYALGGVQLPLEARMMGMFVGLTMGVLDLATIGRTRSQRWPRLLVALALLLGLGTMGVDGVNALLFDLRLPHLYVPDLRLRLATGVLAGVALAFGLMPALGQIATRPDTLPTKGQPGWWDIGWSLLASSAAALLLASGWAPLLHPLALLGAGGVVLAFSLINRVALTGIVLMRGDADSMRRHEWWLGTLATSLAVGELVVLAIVYGLLAPR
jgi:uncharacterized membrane protein